MKSIAAEYELEVASRTEIAEGVLGLDLKHPDGAPLPHWTAGAHIDIVLDDDFTRQYSLVKLRGDEHFWQIGVLKEVDGRGGSQRIHDTVHVGAKVRIRGPRNHFQLEDAQSYIFIAGGIGITPITGMVIEAEERGVPWRLTYGGRTRSTMAFADELSERFGDRVDVVPQDERGLIDLDAVLGEPAEGTLVYCCGPAPLLEAVAKACATWPSGTVRFERFAPIEVSDLAVNESFEVELSESGIVLEVPSDKSILQVVSDNGIDVLSSCAEGTCGTCETYVVSGEVDHRDSVLSDDEKAANDSMMICVSRAACPRLVLEL